MACNTVSEILRGCENNLGGIKKFYVNKWSEVDVAGITTAAGVITALPLIGSPAQQFVEFQFTKNTSSFVEEASISLENGSTYYTTTTTLMIPRREAVKRESLALLAAGQQDLFIIIEDQNGLYWAQGLANGANLTAQGEGSGVAKADGSKYSLTFLSEEPEQMYEVDSTLIAALI